MRGLGVNSGPTRTVLYTSLVRCAFGVAYTINPATLGGSEDDNTTFLVACDKFAQQPVRALALSEGISKAYTLGLPVASLFRSKQIDMLKAVEFMTNPIDILYRVYLALNSLAQYFASSTDVLFLSFDDTLTLLLALMSMSPPGNAVAIAAFVERWQPLLLSQSLSLAKNYFVAAVHEILDFGAAPSRACRAPADQKRFKSFDSLRAELPDAVP
jgi:hypothetical protein